MRAIGHMQGSLQLSSPLIEVITYLHPNERIQALSLQNIKTVGSNILCVKDEEILLTDGWRIYADSDIPVVWIKKAWN